VGRLVVGMASGADSIDDLDLPQHAKSGVVRSADPADPNSLARDLERCAEKVDAFSAVWEGRVGDGGRLTWAHPVPELLKRCVSPKPRL
jgi:hypothetical protein